MPTSLEDWVAFYQEGGELMHVILAFAVVGMLIVLERGWKLLVGQNVDAGRLMGLVQARLLAGDTAGALSLCPHGRSHVLGVVRVGLMAGVDPLRAEAAVQEQRLYIVPRLRAGLPTLSAIAGLAMLVGLLGTVMGLTSGFTCVAYTTAAQRAAALAESLGIAVHTSGFGIMVGVLLLSARLWLSSLSDRLVANVELCGAKVVNLIRIVRTPSERRTPPYRQCPE
jgi:biopolymer transport protein ExbB